MTQPVIVEKRTKVEDQWVCPHCKADIGEKELGFNGENQWTHRKCGGSVSLPQPSESEMNATKKNWGDIFVDQGFSSATLPKQADVGSLSISRPKDRWGVSKLWDAKPVQQKWKAQPLRLINQQTGEYEWGIIDPSGKTVETIAGTQKAIQDYLSKKRSGV